MAYEKVMRFVRMIKKKLAFSNSIKALRVCRIWECVFR